MKWWVEVRDTGTGEVLVGQWVHWVVPPVVTPREYLDERLLLLRHGFDMCQTTDPTGPTGRVTATEPASLVGAVYLPAPEDGVWELGMVACNPLVVGAEPGAHWFAETFTPTGEEGPS